MERRFICDEMLRGLGRWLRAAGYDTLIVTGGMTDRELMALVRQSGRLLITRDRHLMRYPPPGGGSIVLLRANALEACIEELSHRLAIDWLHAPFSRCLVCNSVLEDAPEARCRSLPADILSRADKILYCPVCDKLYWEGSHVGCMRRQLHQYAAILPRLM